MTFSALDSELTGPLFASAAMRDIFSDKRKLKELLSCEAALAKVQARFSIAPAALAEAILTVLPDDFDLYKLGAATERSGVPSIPFLSAVRQILPETLEPALHRGATTQDILDTALVLQMRAGLDLVEHELTAIVEALIVHAERFRRQPCVGRTYGQHAAPLTFGYKVSIWCSALADCLQKLPNLRKHSLVASLAGPVGTLTALGGKGPLVAEAFAQELGLSISTTSWHVSRAPMVEIAAWLSILMGGLAKMAGDIVNLTSTEVGEVFEPALKGRGGSSAMPHKRNPVACSIILAAHAATKGHLVTMLDAMAAAHERPAGAWHSEWHAMPQMFGLASGALKEARLIAEGMTIDPARMQSNMALTRGLLFADAAAVCLAPIMGGSQAHDVVEQACERVRLTHEPLRDVLMSIDWLPTAELQNPRVQALLDAAFDPTPAIEAAALWADRAIEHAKTVIADVSASKTAPAQ